MKIDKNSYVYTLYLRNMRNIIIILVIAVSILAVNVYLSWELIAGFLTGSPDGSGQDFGFVLFYGIMVLALLILGIYFGKNPDKHPTLRQLAAYGEIGEIADTIENECKNGLVESKGKIFETENWRIRKGMYVTTIRRLVEDIAQEGSDINE